MRCVSSPACLLRPMYSVANNAALPALGLPIRRSAGQRLFSASPRLIAAVHVLLRLLVPRHPPSTLIILTVSPPPSEDERGNDLPCLLWPWCSFQAPSRASDERSFHPRSLKTEQRARRNHQARELGCHRDQVRSTFWGPASEKLPALPGR